MIFTLYMLRQCNFTLRRFTLCMIDCVFSLICVTSTIVLLLFIKPKFPFMSKSYYSLLQQKFQKRNYPYMDQSCTTNTILSPSIRFFPQSKSLGDMRRLRDQWTIETLEPRVVLDFLNTSFPLHLCLVTFIFILVSWLSFEKEKKVSVCLECLFSEF